MFFAILFANFNERNKFMESVKIHTPFIKLGDFMKYAGMTENGAQAKAAIQAGLVSVNGEICCARGRKLQTGDEVAYDGQNVKVG